uniref:hypothetical protein n=1 Tax=Leptospira interrogans TaxID=173 RepID=UPI000519F3BB
ISPKGERIPLSELAEITQEDSPTMIFRQDGKRTITVRLNVRGRDQEGLVLRHDEYYFHTRVKNLSRTKN